MGDDAVAVEEVGSVGGVVDGGPVAAEVMDAVEYGLGGAVLSGGDFVLVEFEDVAVTALQGDNRRRTLSVSAAECYEEVEGGGDAGRAVGPGYEYQHRGSALRVLRIEVGTEIRECGASVSTVFEGFPVVDIEKCLESPDFRRVRTPGGNAF